MKEPISEEKGKIQDEEVVPPLSDGDNRLEDDDASVCSLSENKSSLHEINPKRCGVLNGSKCNKKRCNDEVTVQNWRSFNSSPKNMAQYLDGFSEFRSSHSLSIICRSPSRFHIPLNLSSSSFLFDSMKTRRRTRSTTDLGNFIVECASADGPKNVIINPYGKWMIDTRGGNDKRRSIMRKSLLLSLGDLESNLGLSRAMSVHSGETKSPLQKSFPNVPLHASQEKSKSRAMPLKKKNSAFVTSDEMFNSGSSSISTCSSVNCTTFKGLLHFLWHGGTPYFVFVVDDNGGETYVANPWKVSSSDDKTLDYMYLFHSCSYHQKSVGRFGNSTPELVGKMKVSSSLSFNSNRSRFMETEFVLFGAREDCARDTQNSSTFLKNMGLSKKVTDIFRISNSSKHKSGPQKASLDKFEDFPCLNKLDMFDKSVRVDLLKDRLRPNLELAAIIIKDHQHEHSKETVVGGWGLKFLEKSAINYANASVDVSFSTTSCQESSEVEKVGSSRSINVLVPAGFHGGPSTKVGGPSSLTERWRSGGHCECGGWDIGCPLTVLDNRSVSMGPFSSQEDSQEDQKSFNLFTQGTKEGEATLRMVNVREGLYFVYFQSSLSALQSFSIGVAMIHGQMPAICEHCKYCT